MNTELIFDYKNMRMILLEHKINECFYNSPLTKVLKEAIKTLPEEEENKLLYHMLLLVEGHIALNKIKKDLLTIVT